MSPSRRSRISAGWLATCTLAVLTSAAASIVLAQPDALLTRARELSAVADTLRPGGASRDSLLALSAALLAEAKTAGHERARLAALTARATLLGPGRSPDGPATREEGLRLARELADLDAECRFLVQQGTALSVAGRLDEVDTLVDELADRAAPLRGSLTAAMADRFRAIHSMRRGRVEEARPLLEQAAPVFARAGRMDQQFDCELVLGVVERTRGRVAAARSYFDTSLALAVRLGRNDLAVYSLGNLAGLETDVGRFDRAVEHFESTRHLAVLSGRSEARLIPLDGLGTLYSLMHRHNEAYAMGDSLVRLATAGGPLEYRGRGLYNMATARLAQGRRPEAHALFRRILALGDSLPGYVVADASFDLVRSLTSADSAADAMELLDRIEPMVRGSQRLEFRMASARYRCFARMGEWRNARDALERVRPSLLSAEGIQYAPTMMADLGRAHLRLGARDSAASNLRTAREFWERMRDRLVEPEWRERFGFFAAAITGPELQLRLSANHGTDEERWIAAFDAIEPLRARTLLERACGRAVGADVENATIDRLRSATLGRGELLLQWVVTEDTTVVFAVTRDRLTLHPVHANPESLALHVREYRRFMGSAPERGATGRTATLTAAAAALGDMLLGPVREWIEAADRVIVVPDGSLHHMPFAGLIAAYLGEREALPKVAVVPSATLLTWIRARHEDPDSVGFLAVSGPDPRTGAPVPGALREVQWLSGAFEGVTMHGSESDPSAFPDLGAFEVVHVAAHGEANDDSPWLSGVYLNRPEDADAAGYLTAAAIGASRFSARLVVLSGCETAFGALVSGEGLTGLSSAFIQAGVPTVLGTLWKVDDRVTIDLMRAFYRSLADDNEAARALRDAQAKIRSRGSTRDPFYWAGFVLVGEPGTSVPIAGRAGGLIGGASPVVVAGLVILVLGLVCVAARRARRAAAGRRPG